jgi:hypothetical protein
MAKTETTTPTRSVEELEALLAAKEAEIAQLHKAVEKKAADKKEETAPASGYSEDVDKLKQRVSIRLPLQGSNKEPVFVRFGDETFTIRRGADVSVPYYVYLHLIESQQADESILMRMTDLSGDFFGKVEAYKL